MTHIEAFALLFDAACLTGAVLIARRLRRGWKPQPLHNYRPSDDDERSGRRITLFIYPKKGTGHVRTHR